MKDNINFFFPNGYEDIVEYFIFDDKNFKIYSKKNNKEYKISHYKNKIFITYKRRKLQVNRLFYLYYNKILPELVKFKNGNIFDLSKDNLIAETIKNHRKELVKSLIDYSKKRKKDPFVKLMKNLKRGGERVNKSKKIYGINKSILKEIFKKQNGRCFWLGIKLDPEANLEANHPLALSIDRIDNEKGYEINNIVISSRLANLGRSSYSAEKMKIICGELIARIKNNE